MKILVIEALGLHLGYLGCYGNDWVATPNLDRLAVEGIVFDWHYVDEPELSAIRPWGRRSVGTGCYAAAIAAGQADYRPIAPRIVRCESLVHFADQVLQETTAGDGWLWIEGPSLLPPWDLEDELLDAYFDEDDVEEGLMPWRDPPLEKVALDDAEIVRLQNSYAAVVTFFDAQIGKILEHLKGKDDWLICVTARSGLPLGEHGMIGLPTAAVHDELVHVPLLIRLPGAKESGVRVRALTQSIDLLPTVLDAMGQPAPPMDGRSLLPLIRGEIDAIRPQVVARVRVGEAGAQLLRTADWALQVFSVPSASGGASAEGALASRPLLYVKPDDRWEVNDLYQQQIEAAEKMEGTLREIFGKASSARNDFA